MNKLPPRSPFGLLQEDLVPNEWLILISCMMLNCTSRKQVEKVFPTFIKKWPTPQQLLSASRDDIVQVCKSLGFASKRTDNIIKMTNAYLNSDWNHASELPGIGAYAARSWEIFCRNILGAEMPQDHALTVYWKWRTHNGTTKTT